MGKEKDTVKWIWEMPKDLDKQFRDAIGEKLGARRGNIKLALEQAIGAWIKK